MRQLWERWSTHSSQVGRKRPRRKLDPLGRVVRPMERTVSTAGTLNTIFASRKAWQSLESASRSLLLQLTYFGQGNIFCGSGTRGDYNCLWCGQVSSKGNIWTGTKKMLRPQSILYLGFDIRMCRGHRLVRICIPSRPQNVPDSIIYKFFDIETTLLVEEQSWNNKT